ncbi:MAG TPA: glycosyltransferase [Opitutaceae bacterium]|nr:glycosyltransferase [Opitutaceae bacterium]
MTTARELNPLFAGIDLVPSMGGPFKTVRCFQRALGGRVVSFTHPRDMHEADGAITYVRSVGGPLGRLFLPAAPGQIARADALLPGVNLLSCHILYRHSAHWVRSRARRLGVPYWVVPHGCLDPYVFTYRAGIKRAWMQLFGRRMLRDASSVIFSTRREMEKARPWLERDNARVVRWPVELTDLTALASARALWRGRLGIPPDARVLLSLGRLHPMKRPIETVRALVAAEAPGVHLIVAGPESRLTAAGINNVAREAGVGPRVHAIGPVYGNDKSAMMLAVDGLISLSVRENFNHSAAEAMAAGIPVILSPGNDLAPDLEAVGCGWMLHDDSSASAAGAIQEFARATPAALAEMGARGRDFVRDELSHEVFTRSLRSLAEESLVEPPAHQHSRGS